MNFFNPADGFSAADEKKAQRRKLFLKKLVNGRNYNGGQRLVSHNMENMVHVMGYDVKRLKMVVF